jgi:hypothetical protein
VKKPVTVASRLAERIAENRRGSPIEEEEGKRLLDEYLATKTSYRKLAEKHKRSVGAVMRAIHRAAQS